MMFAINPIHTMHPPSVSDRIAHYTGQDSTVSLYIPCARLVRRISRQSASDPLRAAVPAIRVMARVRVKVRVKVRIRVEMIVFFPDNESWGYGQGQGSVTVGVRTRVRNTGKIRVQVRLKVRGRIRFRISVRGVGQLYH